MVGFTFFSLARRFILAGKRLQHDLGRLINQLPHAGFGFLLGHAQHIGNMRTLAVKECHDFLLVEFSAGFY